MWKRGEERFSEREKIGNEGEARIFGMRAREFSLGTNYFT
jgi:hypothetical protein